MLTDYKTKLFKTTKAYGSGVYMGLDPCRMYCVE